MRIHYNYSDNSVTIDGRNTLTLTKEYEALNMSDSRFHENSPKFIIKNLTIVGQSFGNLSGKIIQTKKALKFIWRDVK